MAAPALDVPQLASFCSVPQETINTLLDAPTTELVNQLLQNVATKSREFQELEAAKVRSEVNLEMAVRGRESNSSTLRSQLEKAHEETAALRTQLQSTESSKSSNFDELLELRSRSSTHEGTIKDRDERIEALEASNRDKLSLVDAKTKAYDNLVTELEGQYEKNVQSRKQLSASEEALGEERSAHSAAKFREETQKQAIEQLEKRNEYLDGEIKSKSNEYTKFRKEKYQEVSGLERQNEDLTGKLRQLSGSETMLRRSLEELSEKAEERSQRILAIQEDFVQKENGFRIELDAANRLAALREHSAATDRERVRDLTEQIETLRRNSAEEIGHIQAELETEHNAHEEAEGKIAELEVRIERLQDEVAKLQSHQDAPSTPQHETNGLGLQSPGTGSALSARGSPSSTRLKGGLSVTRLYSENNDLKRQINIEKRRNEEITNTMNSLVADMEEQAPQIQDLQNEHDRLESEVSELTSLIDSIGKERDEAVKAAKKQQGLIEAKSREGEILRQQLRDLSAQLKMLLIEAQLHDQGKHELSVDERAELERLARHNVDLEDNSSLTDTNKYISINLVPFRNVVELQDQNSKLLRLTRELGERMEHEEALRTQAETAHNFEDLQHKYERCKEEMKSLVTQSQSYIRERDMFRTMLENRGQLHQENDISTNGEHVSLEASQSQVLPSVESTHSTTDIAEYAKLVKDMQAHFDAYRTEASTDKASLKQQIEETTKSNNELRTEAARSNNQAVLASDRYEMVKANLDMLQKENSELSKRSTEYYENVLQQDKRVQRVAEDLVEAQGLVDSMRNEVANLKAENDFLKSVKTRLTEDNESVLRDRSHLQSVNASLQSILNERERSESESRRRWQAQVDNLESDLRNASSSLRTEIEENKQRASRHDFESEQRQAKIDDLVTSLGEKREALAKANTAKDHVSREAEELKIELRSAKERLDVFQSSSAPANQGIGIDSSAAATSNSEQDLKVRISELRRDLDLRQKELDEKSVEVEQYRAISQASEDDLQSMNEAHDLYRQDQEKLNKEKDAEILNHKERVADLSAELASLNREVGELRSQEADHQEILKHQKEELETKIKGLNDENEARINDNDFYKDALKTQADIAQKSQGNYESELIRHAEATTALTKVRSQLEEVRLELKEANTAAQTARSVLSDNEEAWVESKERLENEINDLRSARQDLRGQNDRLHQQLQKLHTDQKRLPDSQVQAEGASLAPNSDNLQEIVNYLRREKEIVDTQLELSAQEAKRLKQQLTYTQAQLDDARLKAQQHSRLEAETASSTASHKKLMETIQDLNMHRESNVTLRAEAGQAQANLTARSKEVEELRAQIEPLQDQLTEVKGEREALQDEIKLEKENSDRWQQRAQTILQKYDRVDPAELEALKDRITSLENERDELTSTKNTIQEQLDAATAQIDQAREQSNERVETMRSRLTEQFKGRSKQLSDRLKEKDSQLQAAATEKQNLEEQIAGLTEAQAQASAGQAQQDGATQEGSDKHGATVSEGEEGELNEQESAQTLRETLQTTQARLEEAEARIKSESDTASSLREGSDAAQTRVAELQRQVTELESVISELNEELSNLRKSQPVTTENTNGTDQDVEIQELRRALATAQEDAQQLRTADPISVTITGNDSDVSSKELSEQISQHTEAVRTELRRRHDERAKNNDESYTRRVEAMKVQLSRKLAEGKQQFRDKLTAEHEQAISTLKSEHEAAVEQLLVRHKDEVEELKRLEDSKISEMRTAWEKERSNDQSTKPTAEKKEADEGPPAAINPLMKVNEQEARELLRSNETITKIVKGNILSQVRKQTDKLNAEHQKAMAEAQVKANTVKDHAVTMEGKKSQVQLNVANNKAKLSQFKLDLVEKAAQETPERPVNAVWENIRNAKPSQPSVSTSQQPAAKPPTVTAAALPAANTTNGDSSNATSQPKPTGEPSATEGKLEATSAETGAVGNSSQAAKISDGAMFGKPTPITQSSASENEQQRKGSAGDGQITTGSPNPEQRSTNAGDVQKQPVEQVTRPGTGPNAARPAASGLPVPRGGASRGIQRGRGSGIGRGGPSTNTTQTAGQPARRGSPGRGGMNAQARQFVPVKRPREDGQDGIAEDDGSGKRIKGGATGSA